MHIKALCSSILRFIFLLCARLLFKSTRFYSSHHSTQVYAPSFDWMFPLLTLRILQSDASSALSIEPTHVKSLIRRATSRNALGKHRAALVDLNAALVFEPFKYVKFQNTVISPLFIFFFTLCSNFNFLVLSVLFSDDLFMHLLFIYFVYRLSIFFLSGQDSLSIAHSGNLVTFQSKLEQWSIIHFDLIFM